ncbi:FAD-dependent pyridine nucleotide-disulphide oxidoreductase [Syntrophomonas zehnderi OL-4]|uniref:FAD-dependent pyridine nucleotide-disulphide oxidoreductase n=1 Tax=Syntrophomonas zehnderi OL-4 TaxID=690567 RepID=A0A0E4GBX9_9FIRM|nr:NAD(P)/FAD-dependent oxidoreductase [Syntrophomonas zehnderi]CFX85537.1 FAD-dependent pyridine nucleotide-disulphide oxidoreductase [Syntrophomonas zehnderi OL-4]
MKDIIVIGAGPAGMMAAGQAAEQGGRVWLLEKKDRVGSKLRITGKGRCNITADVDLESFIKAIPGNGRFLYSVLHEFSKDDLVNFFNKRGLKTKVERGNRVFPVSDNAQDVVDLLYNYARVAGVNVITSVKVLRIEPDNGKVAGVETNQGFMAADAVIIATGGMSYPGTGSTGDGYQWAQSLGHTIIKPRPGLVPLVVEENWIKDLQGLSLKNVTATAYTAAGKKINSDFGELLFTHFGLSGPIILSMSRDIGEYLYHEKQPVTVKLDLKPALDENRLNDRVLRDFDKYSRKHFKNALNELLPQKLIPVFIDLAGIDPEKPCHQISRTERLAIVRLLKSFTLTITKTRPLAEAIVTAGGVSVKEVNPQTMESKLVQGLYFAGEVLDVDGYTGGYNLQSAFSTGFVAGRNAAR